MLTCVCRYVISTLELMVAEDYMIVYLNGATPRRKMPGLGWMKKCYHMINRRYNSNTRYCRHPKPNLNTHTFDIYCLVSGTFSFFFSLLFEKKRENKRERPAREKRSNK